MAGLQSYPGNKLVDVISVMLLAGGTMVGCWIFWQVPDGADVDQDYAYIIFRAMTGLTFGFVISGLIIMPLRERVKSLLALPGGTHTLATANNVQ